MIVEIVQLLVSGLFPLKGALFSCASGGLQPTSLGTIVLEDKIYGTLTFSRDWPSKYVEFLLIILELLFLGGNMFKKYFSVRIQALFNTFFGVEECRVCLTYFVQL